MFIQHTSTRIYLNFEIANLAIPSLYTCTLSTKAFVVNPHNFVSVWGHCACNMTSKGCPKFQAVCITLGLSGVMVVIPVCRWPLSGTATSNNTNEVEWRYPPSKVLIFKGYFHTWWFIKHFCSLKKWKQYLLTIRENDGTLFAACLHKKSWMKRETLMRKIVQCTQRINVFYLGGSLTWPWLSNCTEWYIRLGMLLEQTNKWENKLDNTAYHANLQGQMSMQHAGSGKWDGERGGSWCIMHLCRHQKEWPFDSSLQFTVKWSRDHVLTWSYIPISLFFCIELTKMFFKWKTARANVAFRSSNYWHHLLRTLDRFSKGVNDHISLKIK
jgi:hypothetical protein